MVAETGFNSSPITKGVLFRAVKPAAATVRERFEPVTEKERPEDMMDYLLKRALQLGAEKAKIIDTDTIVMAEWVRWKYEYGCPPFEKDPFPPPFAPDPESTKKVLKEYNKALLLNGSNGIALTAAALHLEGEAYRQGYYKAFALTSFLPSSGAAFAPPVPDPELCCPGGT